jgi:hypothetical protein
MRTFCNFGAHGGTRSRFATPVRLASLTIRVPPAKRAGALLVGYKNKKGSHMRTF